VQRLSGVTDLPPVVHPFPHVSYHVLESVLRLCLERCHLHLCTHTPNPLLALTSIVGKVIKTTARSTKLIANNVRIAEISRVFLADDGTMGGLGSLALARWAGWSSVQVGRHIKC